MIARVFITILSYGTCSQLFVYIHSVYNKESEQKIQINHKGRPELCSMNKKLKRLFIVFSLYSVVLLEGAPEVLFAPDDHPTNRLLTLIDQARSKIYAAVYMITDKQIAQALINAKKRGVDVQIIVDTSSVNTSYGKGNLLKENNIDLFVFNCSSKYKKSWHSALMHNKFALIDQKLWTGSFNWTKSANLKNQENVIIIDTKDVCEKFEKHFQRMKIRCAHYGIAQEVKPEPWWMRWYNTAKESIVIGYNEAKKAFKNITV
jgi:phosphatidylserine/phosphatidylglycerophosphate/cardiolipin synthase-like enzyme